LLDRWVRLDGKSGPFSLKVRELNANGTMRKSCNGERAEITDQLVENDGPGGRFIACSAQLRRSAMRVFRCDLRDNLNMEENEPSGKTAIEMYMTSFHNRTPASVLKRLLIRQRPSPSRIHTPHPFPKLPYIAVHHIRETFVVQTDKTTSVEPETLASERVFG
jgi:hypothetical protein